MVETAQFEDFITENDLMEKFSIGHSALSKARKKKTLPYYQVGGQGGSRLYLKQEITNYFFSCRKSYEPKAAIKTKKNTK